MPSGCAEMSAMKAADHSLSARLHTFSTRQFCRLSGLLYTGSENGGVSCPFRIIMNCLSLKMERR